MHVSVVILLFNMQFDAEKQQLFKETTAKAVNEYCRISTHCKLLNVGKRLVILLSCDCRIVM